MPNLALEYFLSKYIRHICKTVLKLYLISMDNSLIKSLQSLGLDPKEIKFFEASFKIGPATINEVAKKSKLQRSTTYLIAQELLQKGYLEEDLTGYKKKISAIDPKKILQLLSAKQRLLRRQELELEEKLPNLQVEYSASEFRPKVKVFEGNQGLLKVWADILSTKTEILLWTNQETETAFFNINAHNKFIDERVKKGIPIRVLAVDNKKIKNIASDGKKLRQTKILPKTIEFSPEVYIYDHKVAILDYNKDIIGVIVESLPIVNYHRSIFELNWSQTDLNE